MPEKQLTILNKRGLHARASAKFVNLVNEFDAEVEVEREGNRVIGSSIMELLLLGAAQGQQILVSATGPEAEEALLAIEALLARKFDEEDEL